MSDDKTSPAASSADDDRATIIGINFGNSNASIAIITKEGNAECIANEDGERQIAAAISFHGEELYIGNQATPQLVKNAQNTITGFRDLLGKKFSEIENSSLAPTLTPSAPVIQHPSLPDTPCYAVQVLVPSPSPLPLSRGTPTPTPPPSSRPSTQHPTPLPTPRSEPVPQTRHLTPHDAAVLFLKSLSQSAADFLGTAPAAAVITVPCWFTPAQRTALEAAAAEAGLRVVRLLEEDAAAAAALAPRPDRTTVLVDWGATHLAVSLLSVRAGLTHILATRREHSPAVDEALLRHFAKEFTKKTGESLTVCPPTPASARAQTKLVLALLHVKRSLTSSTSTQLSIESLAGGLDFSTGLNRTRATGLLAPAFAHLAQVVKGVLAEAKCEWVDSVAWVGGGGRLFGVGAADALIPVVGEHATDEDIGAPEEALAKACAVHAGALVDGAGAVDATDVLVTHKTLGVIIPEVPPAANGSAKPDGEDEELGGQWIPVVLAETPLPARRTVRFSLSPRAGTRAAFEVWEVAEVVRVRRVKLPRDEEDAGEEEEEEEEEEKERGVRKEGYLGALVLPLSANGGAKKGRRVNVRFDVDVQGELVVSACEEGGEWVRLRVGSEGDGQ